MAILPLPEMLKLKELAGRFGYTVHLHDTCGAQSFTLEPAGDNQSDDVYKEIEKFFLSHRMTVNFYDKEKLNFAAK